MSGSLPIEILKKYKGDSDIFFETGTDKGDTVQTALECGFSDIFSVEIDSDKAMLASIRFMQYNDVVSIINNNSVTTLKNVLPFLTGKIVFWLDAHADCHVECTPLLNELEAIKGYKYPVTIMIDDMRLTGLAKWKDVTIPAILDKIKEIDPTLDITFEDSRVEREILIAYKRD